MKLRDEKQTLATFTIGKIQQTAPKEGKWLFLESVGWLEVTNTDIEAHIPVPNNEIETLVAEKLLEDERYGKTVAIYFEKKDNQWYHFIFEDPIVFDDPEEMTNEKEKYQEILNKTRSADEFILAAKTILLTQTPAAFEAVIEDNWFHLPPNEHYTAGKEVINLIKENYTPDFLTNWAVNTLRNPKQKRKLRNLAVLLLQEIKTNEEAILSKLIVAWKENEEERERIAQLFFDWANHLAANTNIEGAVRAMVSLIASETEKDLTNLKNQPIFKKLESINELWKHFIKALQSSNDEEAIKSTAYVLQQQPNWWTIFTEEPKEEILEIIIALNNAKEIIRQALRSDKRFKIGLLLLEKWLKQIDPSERVAAIQEILKA